MATDARAGSMLLPKPDVLKRFVATLAARVTHAATGHLESEADGLKNGENRDPMRLD